MAGRRIVVVGAGITGLTAAHRLVVDHPHLDVTVLEASAVTGGKLRTTPLAGIGMDVDEGAAAFLVMQRPRAVRVIRPSRIRWGS